MEHARHMVPRAGLGVWGWEKKGRSTCIKRWLLVVPQRRVSKQVQLTSLHCLVGMLLPREIPCSAFFTGISLDFILFDPAHAYSNSPPTLSPTTTAPQAHTHTACSWLARWLSQRPTLDRRLTETHELFRCFPSAGTERLRSRTCGRDSSSPSCPR